MIRMIAVDLDRTLLHGDGSVSDYTRGVLAQCRAVGMKLVIASARPMRTLRQYIELLHADGAAIGNGALVWTPEWEMQRPLDHGAAECFLARVMSAYPESTVSAEIDDTLYANFEIPAWNPTILENFAKLPQGNVRKVILTYVDEAHLARIRGMLEPGMRLSVANQKLIQVQSSEASKWSALCMLAKQWGIRQTEMACFGDDWDDLEMIERAGWGVAVANALESVKAVADEVAASNEQDGPAKALARYLRMEEETW